MFSLKYIKALLLLLLLLMTFLAFETRLYAKGINFLEFAKKCQHTHFEIYSKEHQKRSLEYARSASVRNYFPQIHLLGNRYSIQSDVEEDEEYFDYGINISQKIIDFRAVAEIALSHTKLKEAQELEEVKRSEVILRSTVLYLNWQEASELKKLNDENLKNLLGHLRNTQKRFRGGDLTKTDGWQSNEHYALAEVKSINARNLLTKAVLNFKGYTGLDIPTDVMFPNLGKFFKKLTYQELSSALEQNPALRPLHKRLEVEKKKVAVSNSAHYPELSLVGNRNYKQYSQGGSDEVETSVMLQLKFSLFSSGRDYALSQETVYREKALQSTLRQERRKIFQKLISDLQEIKEKEKVIRKYKTVLTFARKSLIGVTEEFKSGTKTNSDVLNAQREMISARESQIKETYNLQRLKYLLLYNLGKLNSTFLNEIM